MRLGSAFARRSHLVSFAAGLPRHDAQIMRRARLDKLLFSVLSASMTIALATDALADEASTSYAGQTLIADGLSAGVIVASAFPKSQTVGNVVAWSGLGTYAFATPIIHAAHDNWQNAGISFGMRVLGVPLGMLAGAIVGTATCSPDAGNDWAGLGCIPFGGALGMGISVVAISAVDAVFLAHAPRQPAPSRAATVRVAPTIGPVGRGAGLGLVGTL